MNLKKLSTLCAVGMLLSSASFGQSRTMQSFNDGWQFYKANNSTFFYRF